MQDWNESNCSRVFLIIKYLQLCGKVKVYKYWFKKKSEIKLPHFSKILIQFIKVYPTYSCK
jgi:hypothetical protein